MNTSDFQISASVFDALPHPAFLAACESGVLRANAPGEMLLEHTDSPVSPPRRVQELLQKACDDDCEICSSAISDSVLVRVNERERFYLVDIRKTDDAHQDEDIYLILLTDVTQFRYLSDLRADPLATVAHEVKTPITSMHLAVSLLLEERAGPLAPMQHELLKSAQDDCVRLLDTLEVLLKAAGLTLGSSGLDLKPFSVEALISEVISNIDLGTEYGAIEIKTDVPGDVPEILIDRRRLVVALKNVINNAVRFSPVEKAVQVAAARLGADEVRFTIRDHGPGVTLSDEEYIFERFYTGASDTSPGTGLGLSLAREIVEAHGGSLGIDRSGEPPHPFYIDVPVA